MKKTTIALIALLIALAAALTVELTTGAESANAHRASPARCHEIWKALPPGERWPAKVACLKAVAKHNCKHVPRVVPRSVRVKGKRVDANQRHVLSWIVSEALRRDLPRVYVVAAVIGTTQEATARELDHGHDSSVGPFQLIDDHGSEAERITIEFSGNWFYNGALKVYRRGMTAARLAQAVEKSGHPDAYKKWLKEARRTLPAILGRCRLRS